MKVEELPARQEGKTLEFKRDLSSPKPVLLSLAAFANTAGGALIIGRADNGAIVGVKDVPAGEARPAGSIADGIAPAMMPEWLVPGSCVRVIFRPPPGIQAYEPVNEPANEPVNEPVNQRQQWFLVQLNQRVHVKAEDIVRVWDVSPATAKRDIAGLRQLDLIEFTGAPKTGFYRLKQKGKPTR